MDASWTYSLNNAVGDTSTAALQAQWNLFQLKVKMLVNGWTVVSSSNGSTFSASDNWATYSGLVLGATTSTARSWILLASPIGHVAGPNGLYTGSQSQMYMIIDYQASNVYSARFIYCSTLPTGGSTTTVPSTTLATNQQIISSTFCPAAANSGLLYHFIYTSYNGGFIYLVTAPGTNTVVGLIYSLPLVGLNTYNSLAYPYGVLQGAYSNTNPVPPSTIFTAGVCWNYDGTTGTTSIGIVILSAPSANINGAMEASSVFVATSLATKSSEIGRLPDILQLFYTGFAAGSTAPIASVNYSSIHAMLLPANASISA